MVACILWREGKIRRVWKESKPTSLGMFRKFGGSESIAIDVHRIYNVIDS
jgi:hypothetical protein